MIPNAGWLEAGAALVDGEGRVIESNDKFAFWAGLPHISGTPLADILASKCPTWFAQTDSQVGHLLRSEEHTSELQSRGLISYAVFSLQKEWGYDENTKKQYRRVNAYMTP